MITITPISTMLTLTLNDVIPNSTAVTPNAVTKTPNLTAI